MKAVVYDEYGLPEVLHLSEVADPTPRDNEVRVRVHATTVTAGDWRMRKADPLAARIFNGLFKPKRVRILGFEFAGEIDAVGKEVTQFYVGDAVFGHNGFGFGGYAEYVCVPQDGIMALKPANVSMPEAAALPIGGTAPLKLLKGKIVSGQRVLINGASGSVGTFAVQLAKAYGAQVTGVCSARNFELVKRLGADAVIDYTRGDITARPERYDLIFDAVGKMVSKITEPRFKKLLVPGGTFVTVEKNRQDTVQDLVELKELVEQGKVKPVIDRCYPLEQIVEAHRYVETGHKRGNVVIVVS